MNKIKKIMFIATLLYGFGFKISAMDNPNPITPNQVKNETIKKKQNKTKKRNKTKKQNNKKKEDEKDEKKEEILNKIIENNKEDEKDEKKEEILNKIIENNKEDEKDEKKEEILNKIIETDMGNEKKEEILNEIVENNKKKKKKKKNQKDNISNTTDLDVLRKIYNKYKKSNDIDNFNKLFSILFVNFNRFDDFNDMILSEEEKKFKKELIDLINYLFKDKETNDIYRLVIPTILNQNQYKDFKQIYLDLKNVKMTSPEEYLDDIRAILNQINKIKPTDPSEKIPNLDLCTFILQNHNNKNGSINTLTKEIFYFFIENFRSKKMTTDVNNHLKYITDRLTPSVNLKHIYFDINKYFKNSGHYQGKKENFLYIYLKKNEHLLKPLSSINEILSNLKKFVKTNLKNISNNKSKNKNSLIVGKRTDNLKNTLSELHKYISIFDPNNIEKFKPTTIEELEAIFDDLEKLKEFICQILNPSNKFSIPIELKEFCIKNYTTILNDICQCKRMVSNHNYLKKKDPFYNDIDELVNLENMINAFSTFDKVNVETDENDILEKTIYVAQLSLEEIFQDLIYNLIYAVIEQFQLKDNKKLPALQDNVIEKFQSENNKKPPIDENKIKSAYTVYQNKAKEVEEIIKKIEEKLSEERFQNKAKKIKKNIEKFKKELSEVTFDSFEQNLRKKYMESAKIYNEIIENAYNNQKNAVKKLLETNFITSLKQWFSYETDTCNIIEPITKDLISIYNETQNWIEYGKYRKLNDIYHSYKEIESKKITKEKENNNNLSVRLGELFYDFINKKLDEMIIKKDKDNIINEKELDEAAPLLQNKTDYDRYIELVKNTLEDCYEKYEEYIKKY